MEQENKSFFDKINLWIRNSITIKLLSIGILILLLLIPGEMVKDLIHERQNTSDNAVNEVSGKWGGKQQLAGPFLVIPAKKLISENDKIIEQTDYYYFLPEKEQIDNKVQPEKRYRGIYEVVVYKSQTHLSGHFVRPDFSTWTNDKLTILWNEATIVLGITDMRGIKESVNLNWNDKVFAFNPGTVTHDIAGSGISVRVPLNNPGDTAYKFSLDLKFNGSEELNFAPLGKETMVNIQSEWSNPSFAGAFLPEKREITDHGFTASWKIINLNRNYPQSWKNTAFDIADSYFGVNLMIPVDHYLKCLRSAKYDILIIVLTFLVFFFVELLNKLRIHPFQYILVGLAVCIFYSLLLSFSEHLNFNLAYALAGVMVISAITLYSKSIFRQNFLSLLLCSVLFLIYAFIYVIIQLQDYALLVGSIGLFCVLAIVMYLSQKVRWYQNQ